MAEHSAKFSYLGLFSAISNVANLDSETTSKIMDIVVDVFGSTSKWRYYNDSGYHATTVSKMVEGERLRRQEDPEYNEKIKEIRRENTRKYYADPEHRERKKALDRERYYKKRAEKLAQLKTT